MKTSTFFFTTILSAGFALNMVTSIQAEAPDNRDVVHDMRGQVVRNTFGNCVRTRWVSDNDECSYTLHVAQVQKHDYRLADEDRTVYFEFNKTRLIESERLKLDSLTNTLKSMHDISGVSIVGYADRIGSTNYNENLSEKRAKVVEKYLREHGYLNTTIAKTRWLGESSPITQCSESMKRGALITCLQQDRRVTVEIKYENDTSGDTTNQ